MLVSILSWLKALVHFWPLSKLKSVLHELKSISLHSKSKNDITDLPQDCGRRLIVRIIDDHARNNPQGTFCCMPRTDDLKDGFDDISWGQLANAINRVAWLIEENLGRSDSFESIAYFGPPDIRYAIVAVAAQKTGHKALFSWILNDIETHLHLLEKSNCKFMMTPAAHDDFINDIAAKRQMKHLIIPTLPSLLNSSLVAHQYPYTKTFSQARNDPFATFHTSGSTGFPKLVDSTHGSMAACDAFQLAPTSPTSTPSIADIYKGRRVFAGIPPIRAAGMFQMLTMPAFYNSVAIIGPATLPTPAIVDAVHRYGKPDITILRPDYLAALAEVPAQFARLADMQFVLAAGYALPRELGDRIARVTSVGTYLGSTETLLVSLEVPAPAPYDGRRDGGDGGGEEGGTGNTAPSTRTWACSSGTTTPICTNSYSCAQNAVNPTKLCSTRSHICASTR
ncbi:uncharacterized protein KY384_004006 [Bacidia gigantensis]|uniref:uncharacterized protein n=1 Tax=Bacidia gigantensis TaxID=2732470 RepID=UPI001D053736|nr:uncharacterized protein KY384_004006 [Bacidia gigantensis]KAG8530651.1 hypothetical protein KY384_004006 [Bacidia gigantensis]